MNKLTCDEKVLYTLRSVFDLEIAMTYYVKSMSYLMLSERVHGYHDTIHKTIYGVLRNMNELQRHMNQKLEIFTDVFSESEVLEEYRCHPKYKLLVLDKFPTYIKRLFDEAEKTHCKDWRHRQLKEVVHEALRLYKKRRKMLEEVNIIPNETKNVWVNTKNNKKG